MKVPLTWIKDYVDIDDMGIEELANVMTMVGLEVEEIRLVGLPMPPGKKHEFKYTGFSWPEEYFIVAQVDEVMPHPNADRLVLCRLNDGEEDLIVLTGAPNLYEFKGKGTLAQPLKVAYAREGAVLYDGHEPGRKLTKLKRMKIRGVESFSMICSEKELGISDHHEGVIILDEDAPTGEPLVDYMGDAVLDVDTLPNMVRDASVLGMAREIAAATGKSLRYPDDSLEMMGDPLAGCADIKIEDPELNPRFVLGLIEGIDLKPSPYWVQRRLNLAGMRPINCIVDATNYVMLELGEPLHAFDYDILVKRADGASPTIVTRTARDGEVLTTLDGDEHELDNEMELVTDTAGALSLAGVMGGLESEVHNKTQNVLLEGASWNFINIRKTISKLKIDSEAAYRFSRGVHPALAETGVRLCLRRMSEWGGGKIAQGLLDNYPNPQEDPIVELSASWVNSSLGTAISAGTIADILRRLEFECEVDGDRITAKTPPHRLDIHEGIIGRADLLEEIGRIFGFDKIPSQALDKPLPPQRVNQEMEMEDILRDLLVNLGLQELIAYRMTSPEREARRFPPDYKAPVIEYLALQNPISVERRVMRRSILTTLLEILEYNNNLDNRLTLFEIGPVFLPIEGQRLPEERLMLSIGLTGLREKPSWKTDASEIMDFYDLKGIIEGMMKGLHIDDVQYKRGQHPSLHPGKMADILIGDVRVGVMGELHPLVKANFEMGEAPVFVAEIELAPLLAASRILFDVEPISTYPPVLEDLAVVVDEAVTAAEVEDVIRRGGGQYLASVQIFDIYRGKQLGGGKKSLAFSLTYLAPDRTLTDKEVLKLRKKIVYLLDQELRAKLRS
ncbi:MAG: phenylalanine--tRNA ligase subunit beta [Chloroflexota bacterium]|nr:phenylalanine--tRNA ligase subunit beta [Chloroflexota bacterium]